MKGISLWQPWASLWCSERKVHETRHWRCLHRGWLLVHAAKRFEKDFELDDPLRLILEDEFGGHWAMDLPTGALIGMVNIVDCQPTEMLFGDAAASDDDRECGDFAPGRFAWKRDEFRLFDGINHLPPKLGSFRSRRVSESGDQNRPARLSLV